MCDDLTKTVKSNQSNWTFTLVLNKSTHCCAKTSEHIIVQLTLHNTQCVTWIYKHHTCTALAVYVVR